MRNALRLTAVLLTSLALPAWAQSAAPAPTTSGAPPVAGPATSGATRPSSGTAAPGASVIAPRPGSTATAPRAATSPAGSGTATTRPGIAPGAAAGTSTGTAAGTAATTPSAAPVTATPSTRPGAAAATSPAATPPGSVPATPTRSGSTAAGPAAAAGAGAAVATTASSAARAPAQSPSARIDINSATESQLDSLPGIGPVRAKAIIAGRPWDDLNELVKKGAVPQSVLEGAKSRLALANINTSSAADLAKTLPGIGEVRARAIVAGRPYASPQELVSKKVLTENTFTKLKDVIAY